MTRDPIRRRFGKGAARLRVGLPPEAEPLSAVARTPIRLERRLTVVPFVTALAIAWLLATSPLDEVRRAQPEAEPIQIVFEPTPTPIAPAEPAVEVRRLEPPHRRPAPRPHESLAQRRTPPRAASPANPAPSPTATKPFDPTALATRGAHWSEAAAKAAEQTSEAQLREVAAAAAVSSPARLAQGDASSALPSEVARATRHAHAATMPDPFAGATGTATPTPLTARPGSGGADAGPADALVEAVNAGARSRQATLAALDRGAAEAEAGGRGAEPSARRPEVSAARDVAPLLAGTSSGTGVDGWREVPLDALPDCSPPGRQDLLKKRILLAASVKRECSHASGSYRVVEARSLGAFLMWSRPNPDLGAGQPRDRDACDVLARALACLGDPSSQESKSR
ncbi:MAG: hypothetical protein U0900_13235 [Myxococcota bacterium]